MSQQHQRGGGMKKVPDFPITIRLDDNPLRKKDTRFLCNVRFKNELPEIPSDPKMLLSQLNLDEIGAFRLFSIEKGLKRDVKFPMDMNLPLSSLYIEQYDIYSGDTLDPKDAPLLDERSDVVTNAGAGGRKRKNVPNAPWLMRTKYISNESGAVANKKGAGLDGSDQTVLPLEDQIREIEESFKAAKSKPVHPKNKSLVPVDVKPILPDQDLENWPLVLVNFDGDPVEAMKLEDPRVAETRKFAQGLHLKTLVKQDDDGKGEKFTVILAPRDTSPVDDGGILPGATLQGDYDWMRTYASNVRIDDKNQTFLFRTVGKNIEYADLSTKLFLRKRKKSKSQGETDAIESLKPGKFVLHRVEEE